ncbi:MAG: hypothetical protein CMO55_11530 [Verrucomicrobiales bacterium]|nr:hypothetical protein [Verrucomicrobiales bacterium]
MESYTKEIAENPKVALIHVSHDSDEDSAEDWAVKEKFPWLTVLPGDRVADDLMEFKVKNVVPHYILVNAEGEMLAEGKSEVLSKANSLGSE